MIKLENVTLRRGPTVLFADVNLTIYSQQRVGIIGANGSGKSSLFALILKQLESDKGDVIIANNLIIAHVEQEADFSEQTVLSFVLDGDAELRKLENQLSEAENKHDGNKIALLHEKLANIDAYTAKSRAAKILDGLGFAQDDLTKSATSFSGGWQMRLNLARALMTRSDVLLLDEPTNHLDLDAILWLESWLKEYQGTLLLISHDREFLDRTIEFIAHLYHQTIKLYSGNYSTFETQRALDLQLQQALYEKQQKKIAHMQSFIDRFQYKASKARQAQSRMKAIERMDKICMVQADSEFSFEFAEAESTANPLLTINKAEIGYPNKIILNNINFSVTPTDRIGILGPNGAGKSTFIKTLAGELALLNGERICSRNLKIGYFSQHRLDQLDLYASPLDQLKELAPNVSETNLRTFLGSFGFSGNKIFAPVSEFSGGEKARVALALLVWQKPNLLLLDEPTNHLDLEMRHALSLALQDFVGGMILISHDRFLVKSTVDKLFLVADGTLTDFSGDMDDYHRWLLDYRDRQSIKTDDTKNINRKEQRQNSAKQRELKKPLLKKIDELEKKLENKRKKLIDIEAYLAESSAYEEQNKNQLQQNLLQQVELKKDVIKLEDEWLHACLQRDNFDSDNNES